MVSSNLNLEDLQEGLDNLRNAGKAVGDAVTGAPEAIGEAVTSSAVEAFADAIRGGMAWVLEATLSWWIDTPTLGDDSESTIELIQKYVLPLTIAVAVAGFLWQTVRMVISRKADPLIDIGRGLWNVALWSAIAAIGPPAAARAGDSFSTWSLQNATKGDFAKEFEAALGLGSVGSAGAVIVLGVLAMIAALVQALLLVLREGAVLVLSGVLVLAAAGSFMQVTSGWLRKVTAWLLALLFYKPAAALVYSVGFILIKDADAESPRRGFVGFAMLALSLMALPAMLKLFNWGIGGLESRGGGLGSGIAAGAAVVHATTSLSGAASAAADHARYMTQTLGPSAAQGSTDSRPPPAMAPSGASSTASPPNGMQVAQAAPPRPAGDSAPRSAPAVSGGTNTSSASPPRISPPKTGG